MCPFFRENAISIVTGSLFLFCEDRDDLYANSIKYKFQWLEILKKIFLYIAQT